MTSKTFKQFIDWVMPIKVTSLPTLQSKDASSANHTREKTRQDLLYHQNAKVKCSSCNTDGKAHKWILN